MKVSEISYFCPLLITNTKSQAQIKKKLINGARSASGRKAKRIKTSHC